jgi:hypothetical protein
MLDDIYIIEDSPVAHRTNGDSMGFENQHPAAESVRD